MALVRVKLNIPGFVALRNSPGVQADIARRAAAIAAAAGEGFEATPVTTSGGFMGRARARVVTATAEAMASEAADPVLESAIDAGR